jgi:hypothetical protein
MPTTQFSRQLALTKINIKYLSHKGGASEKTTATIVYAYIYPTHAFYTDVA